MEKKYIVEQFPTDASLFGDDSFMKKAHIECCNDVKGREGSLKVLRTTYKDMKKNDSLKGIMNTNQYKKWL
jgi:hypothetical protein